MLVAKFLKFAIDYMRPAAIEARERARQRRRLAAELHEIDATRRYCDEREPVLLVEFRNLQRAEIAAGLAHAATGAERWTSPAARDADRRRAWGAA